MHDDAIAAKIDRAARVIAALGERAADVGRVARIIAEALAAGGRLYTFGNGGSAAEAMHLAEELIGKYREPRDPFPAICLNADPAALTCIANDFGFDEVFARQVRALARPGDAVAAFSTSGRSPNIVHALDAAKQAGAAAVGFLGKDGGDALPRCDAAVVVPDDATEHIQEAHQVALHIVLEVVEARAAADAGARRARA